MLEEDGMDVVGPEEAGAAAALEPLSRTTSRSSMYWNDTLDIDNTQVLAILEAAEIPPSLSSAEHVPLTTQAIETEDFCVGSGSGKRPRVSFQGSDQDESESPGLKRRKLLPTASSSSSSSTSTVVNEGTSGNAEQSSSHKALVPHSSNQFPPLPTRRCSPSPLSNRNSPRRRDLRSRIEANICDEDTTAMPSERMSLSVVPLAPHHPAPTTPVHNGGRQGDNVNTHSVGLQSARRLAEIKSALTSDTFASSVSPAMLVPPPVVNPSTASATTSAPKKTHSPPTCIVHPATEPDKSLHGTAIEDINTIIVAHPEDEKVADLLSKLPYGIQWLIAGLVVAGRTTYTAIGKKEAIIRQWIEKGTHVAIAPHVERKLCWTGDEREAEKQVELYNSHFRGELSATSPWEHLDEEDRRLAIDPNGCLGVDPGDPFYGGRVTFALTVKPGDSGNFSMVFTLDPPELSSSHRIGRQFGSRRLVRARVVEQLAQMKTFQEHFAKCRFIINGHVFRSTWGKDRGIYLIEVDETYIRDTLIRDLNSPGKLSWRHFLEYHNPMEFNVNQPLAKWCARLPLGFSNSVPGMLIEAEDIIEIDDSYSPTGNGAQFAGRKADAKDIMTDGCGFATREVFRKLREKYSLPTEPCAVQFRLAGSKGLLLLHPDEIYNTPSEKPRAWLRDSQIKIRYAESRPYGSAVSHRVLDVLRVARLKYPARLSAETIINLAENGVDATVFETFMKDEFASIAADFTNWDGPHAMEGLMDAIMKHCFVVPTRLAREAAGSARFQGLRARDDDEDLEDDEEPPDESMLNLESKAWWPDEVSGCPSTLEDTVLTMLAAKFVPWDNALLSAKLSETYKMIVRRKESKYHVEVEQSCEAWVVPDPFGVLQEGEISIRTSRDVKGPDGLPTTHLKCEVLIMRHPCKTPSDIQKVTAVHHQDLSQYTDVIVCPIKGSRSLMSILAGGDHDGDKVMAVWDRRIVAAWKAHPDNIKFADPPPSLKEAFKRDTKTVQDYLVAPSDHFLGAALLKNLINTLVGRYSNFHALAVYKHGYFSDEAWRLSYMFCETLDGSKTGKEIRPEIWKKDEKTYSNSKLDWMVKRQDKVQVHPLFKRERHFIMDALKLSTEREVERSISHFEKFLRNCIIKAHPHLRPDSPSMAVVAPADQQLMLPWKQRLELAERRPEGDLMHDLDLIKTHVQSVLDYRTELWEKVKNGSRSLPKKGSKAGAAFTNQNIATRQNILRKVSLRFATKPVKELRSLSPDEFKTLCASYAYWVDIQKRRPEARPAFDAAMRELSLIKVKASGESWYPVSGSFFTLATIHGGYKTFRPVERTSFVMPSVTK